MKKDERHTTIRLSSEAKELLELLSVKLGIKSKTAVIELAIRKLAEKEKVK